MPFYRVFLQLLTEMDSHLSHLDSCDFCLPFTWITVMSFTATILPKMLSQLQIPTQWSEWACKMLAKAFTDRLREPEEQEGRHNRKSNCLSNWITHCGRKQGIKLGQWVFCFYVDSFTNPKTTGKLSSRVSCYTAKKENPQWCWICYSPSEWLLEQNSFQKTRKILKDFDIFVCWPCRRGVQRRKIDD